jgi:hypothetical protein
MMMMMTTKTTPRMISIYKQTTKLGDWKHNNNNNNNKQLTSSGHVYILNFRALLQQTYFKYRRESRLYLREQNKKDKQKQHSCSTNPTEGGVHYIGNFIQFSPPNSQLMLNFTITASVAVISMLVEFR